MTIETVATIKASLAPTDHPYLTGAFTPTPYSPPLEQAVVPTAAMIAASIRSRMRE